MHEMKDRQGKGDERGQSTRSDEDPTQDQRLAEFPALAALRLTAGDLDRLSDQGFVCAERRGDRTYFKLRFRRGTKQVVRYIGGPDRAAIVKQELAVLQAETKVMRELNARVEIAKRTLREAKRTMEPVLQAHGFVFHGMAIRRRREDSIATNSSS